MKKSFTLLFTLLIIAGQASYAGDKQVGASLHEKYDIALAEIPASAMSAILKIKPDFVAKEAEKELKHGNHYLDIEGVDKAGNEVEFDMLQQDGLWQVVEIQRDLTLEQCPTAVVNVLPKISAKRIIESDQINGIIIYEFYTVAVDGTEKKYEVKFENNSAELLTKEWQH